LGRPVESFYRDRLPTPITLHRERLVHKRALVVDDDASVCELIHTALADAGMDVVTLTRSEEALRYLHDEKFDVVLFDLRMPSPDGVALARQTRSPGFNQMTPIILISDDQSTAAVIQGFEAGASFFLYKPIDKVSLRRLIRVAQGAIEQERRRFRRVSCRAKVRLSFDEQEWEGETIDISLNGMLVKGAGSIPAGSQVHVALYTSLGVKPIDATGCVVRVLSENRMGIQLTQITVAESVRLREFLLPLMLRETPKAEALRESRGFAD
jgi:DNA-binding response OmpR family regulator